MDAAMPAVSRSSSDDSSGVLSAASSADRLPGVVNPGELSELIARGAIVLDVRHNRLLASQREEYESGHIPGAVFVELRTELAGERTGTNGNNPLPDRSVFASALDRWGIDGSKPVVVYGDSGMPSPGRAWWVLRWAGVSDVRILDGGYGAWVAAGGEIVSGTGERRAAEQDSAEQSKGAQSSQTHRDQREIDADACHLRELSADEAAHFASEGRLLDLRELELTITSPEHPDGGLIPGAVRLPYHELFTSEGKFASAEVIERLLHQSGVDRESGTVGLTCGGGVAASLGAFALNALGYETAVHIGSWSEWISDPARPRARS